MFELHVCGKACQIRMRFDQAALRGCTVTMVASRDRLFPRLFTPEISAFYEDAFAKVRCSWVFLSTGDQQDVSCVCPPSVCGRSNAAGKSRPTVHVHMLTGML